jgi:hypothetical protein
MRFDVESELDGSRGKWKVARPQMSLNWDTHLTSFLYHSEIRQPTIENNMRKGR